MEVMDPAPEATVLDVGFTPERETARAASAFWQETLNPLTRYAQRDLTVIGLSIEEIAPSEMGTSNMQSRFLRADGREMPLKTSSVDYVFSNAVIEHVGTRSDQRRFVEECMRVARRGVFITTPNRFFPMDPHCRLPLLHYLPRPILVWIARRLGKESFKAIEDLNSLSATELKACFPAHSRCNVEGVGLRLLPETLAAWAIIRN
jgi:ubiquinone/menaquinone biosynthesis C-methylase UbiE